MEIIIGITLTLALIAFLLACTALHFTAKTRREVGKMNKEIYESLSTNIPRVIRKSIQEQAYN